MKLNKIAYAVSISLAALALTACGNSGKKSSTPQTQTQPSKPNTGADAKAEAEKKKIAALTELGVSKGLTGANAAKFAQENKDKELGSEALNKALAEAVKKQDAALAGNNKPTDPTSAVITESNPFIDDIDVRESPTVSTKHYLRHAESTFDRVSNRSELGSSGDSTDLTVSNPYLSNFVIGSEADAQDNRFAVDSMGEDVYYVAADKKAYKKLALDSSYHQGSFDVLRRNGKDSTVWAFAGGTTLPSGHALSALTDEEVIRTIQEENGYGLYRTGYGNNVQVLGDSTKGFSNEKVLASFLTVGRAADVNGQTGLISYVDGKLRFGAEENVYTLKGGVTELDDKFEKLIGKASIKGTKHATFGTYHVANNSNKQVELIKDGTANTLTTRVFGKNYRDYEGALLPTQTTNNTYVAELDDAKKMLVGNVRTTKLQDVQYGRLTSNIDSLIKKPKPTETKDDLVYRQFEVHGEKGSVDTYFYRGTNQTSIEDMKKVKAKGGTLQYFGHAVTYGIGPFVDSNDSGKLPTAYSEAKGRTLGNFVEATYDTSTDKVTGSIYNLLSSDVAKVKPEDYKAQKLVTFEGKVIGNTVADGVSTKLGKTNEKGSFVASFYGASAQEMGGNVSSISKEKGFGNAKWGAVFGATLGQTGRNYSTGSKK